MSLKKLKFRRQFLLSPKLCPDLEGWDFQEVGKHYLYVHPDCLQAFATSNGKRGILLGHVLNPRQPDLSTSEILEDIVQQSDEIGIAKSIYGLVGRFVLIVEKNNEFTFFNDACGLKSFFFTQQDHKFYAASQPLLLKLVTKNLIEQGERYHSYHDSEYVKSNKENWFPSGTSLYPGVYHLVANHYLKSETLQQTRYWPIKKLETINYEEAKEKFAKLLKLTIDAGSKKYKLGLGITGGFDSRILLSASKDAAERMLFYTLQYRNLDYNSNDIRIPVSLTQKINIPHSLMDCRIPISEEFKEIYLASSDMAHLNDWGHIAYGISQNLPEGTMSVKGSCSETGRCFFYKNGVHPELKSSQDIMNINPKWKEIPFIDEQISKWYDEVKDSNTNKGYNILDLFHWEVSTGSWQSQSQLEWDLVHDTFTPFNNRELLDLMLHIDTKYRSKPNYTLYKDTMNMLWPEVLLEPINPLDTKSEVKQLLKSILTRLGFEKYNR
ncbi:hypothetical protein [Cellulophaga baltica]|uniref:asparagine synthase (glutamine-hydrolyzing) n=1 Tax=Cellulophaga baltica 18 TaxID=1348584 RepID=A0AAU8RAJ6_9FLAO|nr:hypothetical protein [Cellulophaga baltica]AIZ40716.1 hypothetical protein M666_03470 [Cellulophaga baltica 18]